MSASPQRVRCAIYTRKSSEEGLEQAFNSLDAQREACAAYILSQASEGWTSTGEIYDDGGLSGGTLERPALQRLLADVAAKRIDIIVVYKVDRLTRSLLDFAKLVEAFDAAGTSFVSVTQSFNTTTSMGRLTLNMLLSFAQFEREVTAERIRDKIAASKAKGMWMGGIPPLRYKPDGRSLAIVEEHAAISRHIFARYLALGNVRCLADELIRDRVLAPERSTTTGKRMGGIPFSRGQLYLMLKCVTFTGQIGHHGKLYEGKHPAIIDLDTFAAVQATLAENTQGNRTGTHTADRSLLAGKVVDGDGKPLISVHATRTVASHGGEGKARYRYYVSRDLHRGTADTGMRIPAREIERLVLDRVGQLLRNPFQLAAIAGLETTPHQIGELHRRCAELAPVSLIAGGVKQVRVTPDEVVLILATQAIADLLLAKQQEDGPAEVEIRLDARLTRSGRVLRLAHAGSPQGREPSSSLVTLLVQAHRWWAELRKCEVEIKTLASREGVTGSYLTRVLRLVFLSPAFTEAILMGRQPANLNVRSLTLGEKIDHSWVAQLTRYG